MKLHYRICLLSAAIWVSACSSKETIATNEEYKQVELPDSSIVYLNHNSKLTYDKNFNPRRVKLEGEAFFSVNDGETPFVIETEAGEETTVLGTEFFMAATLTGIAIEVEIGIVALRIGTLNIYREIRRGNRIDFGRHDNGLHVGRANHKHKSWMGLMEKDFNKNGKVLKRSYKHSVKGGGNNKLLKKLTPKSGGGKSDRPKGGGSKEGSRKDNDKGSKSGGGKADGSKAKKGKGG